MDFENRKYLDKSALLSVAIIILSAYVIYRTVDLTNVYNTLLGANLWLYTAGLALYYATFPPRGKRWQILLKNSGIKTKLGHCMETIFISFFLNIIVPAKLGDVYRAHRIRPSKEISRYKILGTVVTCRVIDFVILTVFVTGLGGIVMTSQFGFLSQYLIYFYAFFAASIIGFFLLRDEILDYVLTTKLKKIVIEVKEGFSESFTAKKSEIVGLSVFIWFLVGLRVFLIFRALNVDSNIVFTFFFGFFMILLMSIPLTPAGLGVVEVISTSLLAFYGLEPSLAASVVLLDRSITVLSPVVFGSIYTALFKDNFMQSLHLDDEDMKLL